MHWNPCGAKIDIGRVPFVRKYRPFRDAPLLEVEIVWYPARKDAPTLPWVSALDNPVWYDRLSGIFFKDGDFVQEQPFQYSNEKPRLSATGFKPCGTRIDFTDGGLADSGLPPVIYTSTGLPRCCLPAIDGLVVGGMQTLGLTRYVDPRSGEFVAAGTPGAVVVHYPPGPGPGEDCSTAPPAPLGAQQCSVLGPSGELWFAWNLPSPGTCTLTLSGLTDSDVDVHGYTGSCPGGLLPVPFSHASGSLVWNGLVPSPGTLWIKVTGLLGAGAFCLTLTQP